MAACDDKISDVKNTNLDEYCNQECINQGIGVPIISVPTIAYTNLVNKKIFYDDAEHNECPGPWWANGSTCEKNNGLLKTSTRAAHSGKYGYELPTKDIGIKTGIHLAKFATNLPKLLRSQYKQSRSNGVVRYSAYFYIESGFDDAAKNGFPNPWHIQMQWKSSNKFYGSINPKINWGFHNLPDRNGTLIRQVRLNIMDAYPDNCSLKFEYFTSENTLNMDPLPIADKKWIKITVEIYFDPADGYVKIWQAENNTLIIHAENVNTQTQLIAAENEFLGSEEIPCIGAQATSAKYFHSNTQTFTWGITNYLSGISYMPELRSKPDENHVIFADDILVEFPD